MLTYIATFPTYCSPFLLYVVFCFILLRLLTCGTSYSAGFIYLNYSTYILSIFVLLAIQSIAATHTDSGEKEKRKSRGQFDSPVIFSRKVKPLCIPKVVKVTEVD